MLINVDDPGKKPYPGMPLLQLGFRPFFLLAGISAVLLIFIWGWILSTGASVTVYSSIDWHGHEMVYGFVVAVVAGFLLTAVKNWTGRQTANGTALLFLALLWLTARVLPFLPEVFPYWILATIDLSFLPVLAATLFPLLMKSRNYRNLVFPAILMILFAANAVFHLGVMGFIEDGQRYAVYAAVYIVLLLISIMGGRVIPFFIERGLGGEIQCRTYSTIEIAANAVLLLLGALHTTGLTGIFSVIVALIAAVLHLIRLAGWYSNGVWRVPLLWVLVLAYGWIVVGLFLLALSMAGIIAVSLALHALTIGGIGLMTMGMMVRVSMGHSGRKLFAPALIPAAFAALNVAVVVRVILPIMISTQSYPALVLISALIWVVVFGIFVYKMSSVYLSPRVDGRPG
jgi:uncharacterized protein involved in response to NO